MVYFELITLLPSQSVLWSLCVYALTHVCTYTMCEYATCTQAHTHAHVHKHHIYTHRLIYAIHSKRHAERHTFRHIEHVQYIATYKMHTYILSCVHTFNSNGQYTGNTVKPRYFFRTEYNLEISQYRFMP